jgi:hypothetical protein
VPAHFPRWLEIFCETADENFARERADFAKSRAEAIVNRMLSFVSGAQCFEGATSPIRRPAE